MKAHGKICLDNLTGGKKPFNLQKIVGLFYLHFLYMHESWKKIKGESALPTDPAWLYPPPSTITSSQLGAICSLGVFKQLHSTQLLEIWFPASLQVFIFYCLPWSWAAKICETIARLEVVFSSPFFILFSLFYFFVVVVFVLPFCNNNFQTSPANKITQLCQNHCCYQVCPGISLAHHAGRPLCSVF